LFGVADVAIWNRVELAGLKQTGPLLFFFTVESVYDVNREGGKQPDRAAVAARILEEG
jgi:hypothetical protein